MEGLTNHASPKYIRVYTPKELDLLDFWSVLEGNQLEYVYKPSEDTYLILSAIKYELHNFPADSILCQIGSGTGTISANVHKWLSDQEKKPLVHVSIDLNMDASILSKKFYEKYNLNIQQINTSIFNNLVFNEKRADIKPNIIIFNPPYVPVEQEEIDNEHKYLVQKLKHVRENKECVRDKGQNLIAYSYMGGLDGLEITRKILGRIGWHCTAYFIVMGMEGVESIEEELKSRKVLQAGMEMTHFELLHYQRNQLEDLFVIKVELQPCP